MHGALTLRINYLVHKLEHYYFTTPDQQNKWAEELERLLELRKQLDGTY